MQELIAISAKRISQADDNYRRYLYDEIEWGLPLTIIRGPRGSGKTILILQKIKELTASGVKALYCTMDHPYFETVRLYDFASSALNEGFNYLFIDEIHKHQHWSQDLKLIYDMLPEMKIVCLGSSILDIMRGEADLSRRAVVYHLPGLSFREFLVFNDLSNAPVLSLEDILTNHEAIAGDILDDYNVLRHFKKYLQHGYFPFFNESIRQYPSRLLRVINTTIENDIPAFENIDYSTVRSLKKLLYFLAQSVPVIPNMLKLAGMMEVSRSHLLKMMDLMQRSDILLLLKSPMSTPSRMAKPEKIYLHNTNLMSTLSPANVNSGSTRETFFYNQLQVLHSVHAPKFGDFMVDEKYVFEVGGPSKNADQIKGVPNAYLAVDGVKVGAGNRIPLWLFGYLY